MTEDELKNIEDTLGIQIPNKYREFLSSFPEFLITDEDEGIFGTAKKIISETLSSRNYREEDWPVGYTNDLLAVGWNGGGSIYCIKEGESGDTIYLFDHEIGDINPEETMLLQEFIDEWSEE
ncbi:SMI1/KNR4 family protein [Litoribrevibacter euphylliae]|uniref:SMI1/KNR4 family protein n=1 Tax=Litoribrevibacter euphylliae TaxID=1834034 RepID=A0ABV7HL89_9GAMM